MKKYFLIALLACTFFLAACADSNFNIGGGFLGGRNISTKSIRNVFTAGENIVDYSSALSPEEEYFLGRGVAAMIFSRYKPLENPALESYVNRRWECGCYLLEAPLYL